MLPTLCQSHNLRIALILVSRNLMTKRAIPRNIYIVSFLDDFNVYANDHDLSLTKFSKSLIDKAFSLFVNLPTISIHTWDELVAAFCTKFFIAQLNISLKIFATKAQTLKESLIAYLNRFKEKALDCYEIILEKELI